MIPWLFDIAGQHTGTTTSPAMIPITADETTENVTAEGIISTCIATCINLQEQPTYRPTIIVCV
jgi:hypothetical protein